MRNKPKRRWVIAGVTVAALVVGFIAWPRPRGDWLDVKYVGHVDSRNDLVFLVSNRLHRPVNFAAYVQFKTNDAFDSWESGSSGGPWNIPPHGTRLYRYGSPFAAGVTIRLKGSYWKDQAPGKAERWRARRRSWAARLNALGLPAEWIAPEKPRLFQSEGVTFPK